MKSVFPICLVPVMDHTFPQLRLEVLLQVVLQLGSKSFSHSFSALTRYVTVVSLLLTMLGIRLVWESTISFDVIFEE